MPDCWLRTPDAALALACSQNHLKRQRDTHGGFLVEGEDYCPGTSRTAPITWNIDRIRAAFVYRGRQVRKAGADVQQLVEAN